MRLICGCINSCAGHNDCERPLHHSLYIGGLSNEDQSAIRALYLTITGASSYRDTLNTSEMHETVRDAFETITVGLLMGKLHSKELAEQECPHCGPECLRGAAYLARKR